MANASYPLHVLEKSPTLGQPVSLAMLEQQNACRVTTCSRRELRTDEKSMDLRVTSNDIQVRIGEDQCRVGDTEWSRSGCEM